MELYLNVFIWCAVAAYGVALGSFSTALIYRVPRNISWIRDNTESKDSQSQTKSARSSCPHCDHRLGYKDLIPLFSWIFSKGQCRYCSEKISPIYPLAEITCCLTALGIYAVYGLTVHSFMMILVLPFLVALLFIDFQVFRLPNQLVFIMALLALIDIALVYIIALVDGSSLDEFHVPALSRVSAAFVYGGLLWLAGFSVSKVLKKPSLGLGDVKFYAAAGLWLGIAYLPDFMFLCGLLGLIWGFWYKRTYNSVRFPFGPALIAAFYAGLLLQGAQLYFLSYNL